MKKLKLVKIFNFNIKLVKLFNKKSKLDQYKSSTIYNLKKDNIKIKINIQIVILI